LQNTDALPAIERAKLATVRGRALIVRKQAVAFSELGEFLQADPLFEDALKTFQQIEAADTADVKDIRALGDVKRMLEDMASSYENAADPALAEVSGDRRRNLLVARGLWEKVAAVIEQIEKQDIAHGDWKAELASAQVHIGGIRIALHETGDAEELAKENLAVLRSFAIKDHASVRFLDLYVTGLLSVEPELLKDTQFAVSCAEREVALTHRKDTQSLLSLARVYRATGQIEKSRDAANEGLALLPAQQPGSVKENMRKLLEIQAQAAK
jgi:tetratricopeptide (TPR) repeat protein